MSEIPAPYSTPGDRVLSIGKADSRLAPLLRVVRDSARRHWWAPASSARDARGFTPRELLESLGDYQPISVRELVVGNIEAALGARFKPAQLWPGVQVATTPAHWLPPHPALTAARMRMDAAPLVAIATQRTTRVVELPRALADDRAWGLRLAQLVEAIAQWLEAEIGQAITEARQGEDAPLVLALEPEHPLVEVLAEPPGRDYDLLRVTCGFGVVAVSRVF